MARVTGLGMRAGEKYQAKHVRFYDLQIVRLLRIDKPKPEPDPKIDAPYCMALDAHLCKQARGKFASKGEKIQVIIETLLRSVDESLAKKAQAIAIGGLYKIESSGAMLVG